MKKLCKLCYRLINEDMIKSNYCFTCLSIIGKGPGYSADISDERANEWFEGLEERKQQRLKEGYKI